MFAVMPVKLYRLYIKIKGEWIATRDFEASSDKEALRKASAQLPPEHYDKPIRVKKVDEKVA